MNKKWHYLPEVSSCFSEKVEEIERHLSLLAIMLSKGAVIEYKSDMGKMKQKRVLELCDTHPLKAGAVLMIYNFIESISTALMKDIHEYLNGELPSRALTEISEKLRNTIINFNCNLKLNDLKEYFDNYANKKDSIDKILIDGWLKKSKELATEKDDEGVLYDKYFNGNVDFRKLKTELDALGLKSCLIDDIVSDKSRRRYKIHADSKKKRPSSILEIKSGRNRLAHGSMTFSEFGQKKSLDEIKMHFENIQGFFDGLFDIINNSLKRQYHVQNLNQ